MSLKLKNVLKTLGIVATWFGFSFLSVYLDGLPAAFFFVAVFIIYGIVES